MARIPSADQLGRRFADPVTPIARTDVSDVGRGLEIAGNTGLKMLTEYTDNRDRYQLAQAASEFLVKKNTEDNAYAEDQDYGTIESRYTTNVNKSLEESAALIQSPRVRNEFLMRFRPQVAEGITRIQSIASSKEKDYQRGYIAQQLDAITEAGLTGDMDVALATSSALLKTARDSGYISAQEYVEMDKAQRTDMAIKAIGMLEPKARLEAMNQQWAKDNLPADVEQKIIKGAREELVKAEAVSTVDSIMADIVEGGSRLQAQSAIERISDPDLRVEVERRFENEYNRHQANLGQLQEGLAKKYAMDLRLGTIRFDEIPRADLEQMDPSTLAAMQAAENAGSRGPRQQSNPAVLTNTWALIRRAQNSQLPPLTPEEQIELGLEPGEYTPQQDAWRYIQQNNDQYSGADWEQYGQLGVDLIIPKESKYIMNAQERLRTELQALNTSTTAAGKASAATARAELEFDDWLRAEPRNEQDIQKRMDEMVLRVVEGDKYPSRWDMAFDVPWVQLTDEQKWANLEVKARDDARMATIMQSMPVGTTADAIMARYERTK